MAEAFQETDLERSRWELQADDDDDVTMMVRKTKYEEVPGRKKGVFYHTPLDDHLYRFSKKPIAPIILQNHRMLLGMPGLV